MYGKAVTRSSILESNLSQFLNVLEYICMMSTLKSDSYFLLQLLQFWDNNNNNNNNHDNVYGAVIIT